MSDERMEVMDDDGDERMEDDGDDKENEPTDDENDEDFKPSQKSQKSQSQSKSRTRRPAATVQLVWTKEQEAQLLTEVEKYKCLYDEGCNDNKDKFRRIDAWKMVSDCFDGKISVVQCQAKWLSLRATLRKIKKKMTDKKSGQAASSVKPTWRNYDLMSFVVLAENKNRMDSESNLVCLIFSILYDINFILCFRLN